MAEITQQQRRKLDNLVLPLRETGAGPGRIVVALHLSEPHIMSVHLKLI